MASLSRRLTRGGSKRSRSTDDLQRRHADRHQHHQHRRWRRRSWHRAGGGIGGLAIVLLALFLGVDPGPVINQMPTGPAQSSGPTYDLTKCRTGADANAHVECRGGGHRQLGGRRVAATLRGYRRPQMKLFKGRIQTGCGAATSDVGPFYCPADQTAYFDTDFFQVLKTQFGSSGGPLAQEYVVAHEYGHHVQNLLGDLERAQKGAQGAQGGGVRSELQADCYAGVWAHYASTTKQQGTDVTYLQPLTDKDIADALSAARRWAMTASRRRPPAG